MPNTLKKVIFKMKLFMKFTTVEKMTAYKAAFADYLNDVTCFVGITLEKMPVRLGRDSDDNGTIIYFEKSERYKRHCYVKGFVHADFEGIKTLVPFDYAYNEALDCFDEIGNNFTINRDTKFSHSCSYYDASDYTVYDHTLFDNEDVITLNNGRTCLLDNVCWIENEDEYFDEGDCIYSEHYGHYILRRNASNVEGYGHVLDDDDDFFTCDSCNNMQHTDEYAGDCMCHECYSESQTKLDLMCYSTNVLRHAPFGDAQYMYNGKSVFCGIELEVLASDAENVEQINEEICEENEKSFEDTSFVATQDGSLDSKLGLEFIFSPDNLSNYETKLNDFIGRFGDNLDTIAGSGYGLHIHISSHHLSKFDKIKIQNFVSENEAFYRMIGKRQQTNFQAKKMLTKVADKKRACHGRYNMVNILPAGTIEFRYPKSIVCTTHILANIELCFATVAFLTGNHSNVINADYARFIAFIRDNATTYKTLISLI